MVSHPQWVGMQAQPYVTNIGVGAVSSSAVEPHGGPGPPWPSSISQVFPAPAAGPPNHCAMWVPVPVSCLMGKAERDGQLNLTSQPMMSTDEGKGSMWAPKPGSVMPRTCHSNF